MRQPAKTVIAKMLRALPGLLVLWAVFTPPWCLAASAQNLPKNTQYLSEFDPGKDYFPDELWLKAPAPEFIGWSSAKLKEARDYSAAQNTSAVLIIDNGVIVDEWGQTQQPFKLHSVRKSLMNALYGIEVDSGKMKLDATLEALGIDDITPSLTREEKQATIADLLKARSGVYHPAAYETPNMRAKRPQRGSHPPGSHWFYNNWDFNSLVTIYELQTGEKMSVAFYQKIARPLQMEHFKTGDIHYLYEKKKSRHPAMLFLMSARDLARFGLLYLRKGNWNNQRILSEKWIEDSLVPYTRTRLKNHLAGYGYLWWVDEHGFAAVGSGGQTLIVFPKLRLIIVHLAEKVGKNDLRAHQKVADLVKIIVAAHPAANRRLNDHPTPKSISRKRP